MNMRGLITAAAFAMLATLSPAQNAAMLPPPQAPAAEGRLKLDETPKWYEIVGDGVTSGTACPIRSLATCEVIGVAEPQTRFLSFGADRNFVVFAYKGVMSFIPASAAQELYPVDTTPPPYRAPGKTLEQQAEETKKRVEEIKSGKTSLAPNFTNQPTPRPTVDPSMMQQPVYGTGGGSGAI